MKLKNEFIAGMADIDWAWTKWADVFDIYITQVEQGVPEYHSSIEWHVRRANDAAIQSYIKNRYLW